MNKPELKAFQARVLRVVHEARDTNTHVSVGEVLRTLHEHGCFIATARHQDEESAVKATLNDLYADGYIQMVGDGYRVLKAGSRMLRSIDTSDDPRWSHHKIWVSPEKRHLARHGMRTELAADGG